MRSSALIAIAILVHAPASLATTTADAITRFQLADDGKILVQVAIGRAGPFTFILDTGSNGSSISEGLADRLRCRPVARGLVSSATGQREQLFVRLTGVGIGIAQADELIAGVVDDHDLDPTGAASGVIGQDLLGAMRYTIDYRLRVITWGGRAGNDSATQTVLALEPHDDRLLVVLPQAESTIRMVPDTGTAAIVFFRRDGQKLPPMRAVAGGYELATLTGRRKARLNRVSELRVGGATLRDQDAIVLGAEPGATTGDGLLPLHVFDRVTLDGPNRVMIVETGHGHRH